MKYIIPQDKLDKIVFKYLDLQYGDLEKHKPEHYKGFVLKKPNDDSEYGIMGWKIGNSLYIHKKLINEIASMFSIEQDGSEEIIGKWFKNRYKLKVARIMWFLSNRPDLLKIK